MLDQLGQYFGPLLKLAANQNGYDSEEKKRIEARFFSECDKFSDSIRRFCSGEPGHFYATEQQICINAIHTLAYRKGNDPNFDILANAPQTHLLVLEALCSIPVPIESSIHDSVTPFSTYCLVRDLCATANQQVFWMDRYFDQALFARYLTEVPKSSLITLITFPRDKCRGNNDERRYADFMAVSKLFSAERGPNGYRLMTDADFHDRLLRCNDKLFTLGGSIKDLGNDSTFTLAKLDSNTDNFKKFEDAIAAAVEVFGPNRPTHP